MNDWENFNETSLPEKEDFWSQLNMKYLTDEDCTHTKIVCKGFKIKYLGEYHDLIFKAINYCFLMYLRTSEICTLKHMRLILKIFFQLLD